MVFLPSAPVPTLLCSLLMRNISLHSQLHSSYCRHPHHLHWASVIGAAVSILIWTSYSLCGHILEQTCCYMGTRMLSSLSWYHPVPLNDSAGHICLIDMNISIVLTEPLEGVWWHSLGALLHFVLNEARFYSIVSFIHPIACMHSHFLPVIINLCESRILYRLCQASLLQTSHLLCGLPFYFYGLALNLGLHACWAAPYHTA